MVMVMVTVASSRGEDHGSENDGQLLADPHGLVLTCSMVHGPKFSTQSAPRIQRRTWPPWMDKPQSLGALGLAPTNPFPAGPGRPRGPLGPRLWQACGSSICATQHLKGPQWLPAPNLLTNLAALPFGLPCRK